VASGGDRWQFQRPALVRAEGMFSRRGRHDHKSRHGLTMVSISTTDQLFAPIQVGWRQVHKNRLGGACDLDPQLLELNRPAAGVSALDLSHNRRHRTVDLVYAPKLKVVANEVLVIGIATNWDRDAFRRRCL
jgi:hypothetical protein